MVLNKTTPFLKIYNHEIYTPTLTGLGERSQILYEAINLSTHINDIVQVLEYQDLYDVVLVGHQLWRHGHWRRSGENYR